MKICTDACIFGAYMARSIREAAMGPGQILDIGTGTGLLSLMLAQDCDAMIDAVEIDALASEQAGANFNASKWKDRLRVYHADINVFSPDKKYDLIISNPPFYAASLQSPIAARNTAKHEVSLTQAGLLAAIDRLLRDEGYFAVLLPYTLCESFEKAATGYGYQLNKKLGIRHSAGHSYFRGILLFSKKIVVTETSELLIRDGSGGYAPAFSALMSDYYLNA